MARYPHKVENTAIHHAIVRLRKDGVKIYRKPCGAHQVNGRHMDLVALRRFAKERGAYVQAKVMARNV